MMSKTAAEPLVRISKREGATFVQKVLVRAIAILLALVVDAFFIFFVTGLNPISVYGVMWNGTFMNTTRFSWALRDLSSLLCIAIALAPAFKMRFWNIGGEGQTLMGCLASASCMILLRDMLPNWALILVMLLTSMLAGAIWGGIPGALQGEVEYERDAVHADDELCRDAVGRVLLHLLGVAEGVGQNRHHQPAFADWLAAEGR